MISKSAITPSFIGRIATMLPGVRPSISFAALPTARTLSGPRPSFDDGDHARLGHHDALALRVDERVGGAEIDREVVREPAEDALQGHEVDSRAEAGRGPSDPAASGRPSVRFSGVFSGLPRTRRSYQPPGTGATFARTVARGVSGDTFAAPLTRTASARSRRHLSGPRPDAPDPPTRPALDPFARDPRDRLRLRLLPGGRGRLQLAVRHLAADRGRGRRPPVRLPRVRPHAAGDRRGLPPRARRVLRPGGRARRARPADGEPRWSRARSCSSEAERLGLRVGQDEIRDFLRSSPGGAGDGRPDRPRRVAPVRRSATTAASSRFEDALREDLLAQKAIRGDLGGDRALRRRGARPAPLPARGGRGRLRRRSTPRRWR